MFRVPRLIFHHQEETDGAPVTAAVRAQLPKTQLRRERWGQRGKETKLRATLRSLISWVAGSHLISHQATCQLDPRSGVKQHEQLVQAMIVRLACARQEFGCNESWSVQTCQPHSAPMPGSRAWLGVRHGPEVVPGCQLLKQEGGIEVHVVSASLNDLSSSSCIMQD